MIRSAAIRAVERKLKRIDYAAYSQKVVANLRARGARRILKWIPLLLLLTGCFTAHDRQVMKDINWNTSMISEELEWQRELQAK